MKQGKGNLPQILKRILLLVNKDLIQNYTLQFILSEILETVQEDQIRHKLG